MRVELRITFSRALTHESLQIYGTGGLDVIHCKHIFHSRLVLNREDLVQLFFCGDSDDARA